MREDPGPSESRHEIENPYRSPQADCRVLEQDRPLRGGVKSTLVASGLLYRRVLVEAPVEATIEFNGRSAIRDTVSVDGRVVAAKISWWRITPRLDFVLPARDTMIPVTVEVRMWPWLAMRGFRIHMAGQVVYAEGVWPKEMTNDEIPNDEGMTKPK
jgi:hypothetical protein